MDNNAMREIYREIGEIKAIAREGKHAANNASQKVDALGSKFDTLAALVTRQGTLMEAKENHETRLCELEAYKHRQEGALGLGNWLLRNWPLTALIGLLAAIVMWANGKVPG